MKNLEWLIFPDEFTTSYTNFGDGREGDASRHVTQVNADASVNGGHTDWRLPTIEELKSLIGMPEAPTSGFYWSSSPYVGYANYALVVGFRHGYVGEYHCGFGLAVRLVRASQ